MAVDKAVCLEIYKRGARLVIMHPEYHGRLDGFHGWRDGNFQKILTEYGFGADDVVVISYGIFAPGSLVAMDLWEVSDAHREEKRVCLTTTEQRIIEFGGVM